MNLEELEAALEAGGWRSLPEEPEPPRIYPGLEAERIYTEPCGCRRIASALGVPMDELFPEYAEET